MGRDEGRERDEAAGQPPDRERDLRGPADPAEPASGSTPDPDTAPSSAPTLASQPDPEPEPEVEEVSGREGRRLPFGRAAERLQGASSRRVGGRPLGIYAVLLAGALVLLLLLITIWITADDGDDTDGPICTNINQAAAIQLIDDEQVEGIEVIYPPQEEPGEEPVLPAALRLNLIDTSCHNLQPQGPDGRLDMLGVLGAVQFHNEVTNQRRIDVAIQKSDNIPDEVLATSTAVPAVDPTATVTLTIPPTPSPTPEPSPATPASPITSPAVSPDASPEASPMP